MIAAITTIWAQLIESWDMINFPPAVIYSLPITYIGLNTSGARLYKCYIHMIKRNKSFVPSLTL